MSGVALSQEEIFAIAREQSAIDLHCSAEDFLQSEHKLVISQEHPQARKYLKLPFECNLVSYGSNIVASGKTEFLPLAKQYIEKFGAENFAHCFETPNLHIWDEMLAPLGAKTCFMAEYFLPMLTELKPHTCPYRLRVLRQLDFVHLYLPQWSNALCERRKELDVLGVGAYDGERLVGFAACSADCETMWQIGVDVLPEYRRRGVAAAVTSRLAAEILYCGRVPFYCAAWSNIRSVRNALSCGFRPAWVELTAKPMVFVDEINQV